MGCKFSSETPFGNTCHDLVHEQAGQFPARDKPAAFAASQFPQVVATLARGVGAVEALEGAIGKYVWVMYGRDRSPMAQVEFTPRMVRSFNMVRHLQMRFPPDSAIRQVAPVELGRRFIEKDSIITLREPSRFEVERAAHTAGKTNNVALIEFVDGVKHGLHERRQRNESRMEGPPRS